MKVIFFIGHTCSKCKKYYKLCAFKKDEEVFKTCIKCRTIGKNSRIKTKCIHARIKSQCVDCGGSSVCIHHKRKSICKLCFDPIDITIKQIITSSKQKDKKYNRYDQLNFVDYPFLKNLISNSNDKCYYCQRDLQYKYYTSNLGTIERLDNTIGHIKSNCVIACRTCNLSKIGDRINPQE